MYQVFTYTCHGSSRCTTWHLLAYLCHGTGRCTLFLCSAEIQAQLAAAKKLKPETPMTFERSARREGSSRPT
jgi:hypothetical protein